MAPAAKPRRLADVLGAPRGLAPLLAKCRHHARLQRLVQSRLPSFLADHCLACVVNDGQLIVYTDSPAWATPLRFALPAVLTELQNGLEPALRRIQIRILCPHQARQPERRPTIPGCKVIGHIQDIADCSDPELGASLARLAATWRRLGG